MYKQNRHVLTKQTCTNKTDMYGFYKNRHVKTDMYGLYKSRYTDMIADMPTQANMNSQKQIC